MNGAIFDMDGLMFDTEQIWQRCWKEIADERGIVLPEAFKKEICGTSGELMNSVIRKYYQVEDGTEIMKDCVTRVHAYLEEDVPEKPGIHEILQFFQDKGMKIAVASSSTVELIKRNLQKTNTDSFIDAIVSGTQLEHGKPAPDIFLEAARQIGCAPEECYVFEDAFNGVKAGAAAGCKTIMIPDVNAPTEEIKQLCYAIYDNLLEAKEGLEKSL